MSEGDVFFLDYGEVPPIIHARLLIAHVYNHLWVIPTPDMDVYEEIMHEQNPDIITLHRGQGGFGAPLPPALNPAQVYGFRPMSAQRYQELVGEGRTYAAELRVRLGIPPPGLRDAAQVGPLPADPSSPDDMVWVALESDHGYKVGDIVCDVGIALPADSLTLGNNKALVPKNDGALCVKLVPKAKVNTIDVVDLRVLPMTFDEQKNRRLEFAQAVGKMRQVSMPGGGLQLDGPVSSLGVLKGMVSRGLTPVTDHEHWVRTHETLRGDRSIYEMEVITRALEAFIMVDQLNIPNLKGCELLMRRWQLIREAHRLNPGAPDYSAADVFMGWEYRRGDGVNPELAKFVAAELKDQAQIAKESRKAREEMASRKGPGGRGKPAAENK